MVDLQKALKQLKTEFGSLASAVISRDGLLIAADMPEGTTAETFTIMCATLMGAASTAHSELRIGQPRLIRIASEKHDMILAGAGRKSIVVSIVPLGSKIDDLQRKMEMISDNVG
jgi:hypothetical protein